MITVYRVIPDIDNYKYALSDDANAAIDFRFDGTPIGHDRTPPSAYCAHPLKPTPDFWGCFSMRSVFAIDQSCAPKIATFLDQSCECLPLECDAHKLLLCNVILVVNALNSKLSRHKNGLPHWIEEYAFHPHRLDYSLFKIPETAMTEVLCVEGLAAPEDEFKGTVERYGLKGLKFKAIWTGG